MGEMIDFSSAEAIFAEQRRRAERRAKGLPLHETAEEIEQLRVLRDAEDDDRLESDIQAQCVREYRARGLIVYEGLKERRKTRIDKGHPDLTLFHPRAQWFGFHEVKPPKGRLRPDQADFRETCIATGVPHFVGGTEACTAVIDAVNERLHSLGEPEVSRFEARNITLTQAE